MPKLIIFDCDGTLVDSEYLCNLAMEMKLNEFNIKVDAEELLSEFRGDKLARIISTIEQRYGITFPENFIADYRKIVQDLFSSQLEPNPKVAETLARINTEICVASSGPREKTYQALEVTKLLPYFGENIFSSYDIQSWKPEPDIFIHVARSMSIEPQDCMVIEDSELGVGAANAAGMISILYDPNKINNQSVATHTIQCMSELTVIVA